MSFSTQDKMDLIATIRRINDLHEQIPAHERYGRRQIPYARRLGELLTGLASRPELVAKLSDHFIYPLLQLDVDTRQKVVRCVFTGLAAYATETERTVQENVAVQIVYDKIFLLKRRYHATIVAGSRLKVLDEIWTVLADNLDELRSEGVDFEWLLQLAIDSELRDLSLHAIPILARRLDGRSEAAS